MPDGGPICGAMIRPSGSIPAWPRAGRNCCSIGLSDGYSRGMFSLRAGAACCISRRIGTWQPGWRTCPCPILVQGTRFVDAVVISGDDERRVCEIAGIPPARIAAIGIRHCSFNTSVVKKGPGCAPARPQPHRRADRCLASAALGTQSAGPGDAFRLHRSVAGSAVEPRSDGHCLVASQDGSPPLCRAD